MRVSFSTGTPQPDDNIAILDDCEFFDSVAIFRVARDVLKTLLRSADSSSFKNLTDSSGRIVDLTRSGLSAWVGEAHFDVAGCALLEG